MSAAISGIVVSRISLRSCGLLAAATLPGFELMPAFGWVGPANMPPDIVKKLIEEFVAVGKIPEVRTALEKFGVLQTELPGPAYAEALAKERAGYARVIERAGIKVP
jgi:tripartite-type tricarboxylate transporter receptor subunit TctC